jgi:hypothetical protein
MEITPQKIDTLKEGASYQVPLFEVSDEGLVQIDEGFKIHFCKGDKSNPEVARQRGFFTETLIAVAKKYLEDVNTGPLASRETAVAITKLDEALMWIGKRAAERKARGVQGTYAK